MKNKILKLLVCASLSFCIFGALIGCNKQEDETVDSLVDMSAFDGNYVDKDSGRATMNISGMVINNEESNSAIMTIDWSNSFEETISWVMSVSYSDGKLVYSDCVKTSRVYDEDGYENAEVLYENGKGEFTVDENANPITLTWTTHDEDTADDVVFEKIVEESIIGAWTVDIGETYGATSQDDESLTTLTLYFTEDGQAYNVVGDISFDYAVEDNGNVKISNLTNKTDIQNIELQYNNGELVFNARVNGANVSLNFEKE